MTSLTWKEQVDAKKQAKTGGKLAEKAAASSAVGVRINTNGWRSEGNASLFKLEVNDTMVAYYLAKKVQVGLKRSQTCTGFDFEFHPGHPTGYPIYVRMVGNEDSKSMTKFDTKNKSAPQLPVKKDMSDGDFVNFDKVTLSSTEKTNLQILIRDNWEFLQYMAKQIYEGEPKAKPPVLPVL